jgi:hypothetical protein
MENIPANKEGYDGETAAYAHYYRINSVEERQLWI